MARRRAPEAPSLGNAEGVPAELLVGRCLEVWAVPGVELAHWSAARSWVAARTAWLQEQGVASAAGHIDWHKVRARFGRTLVDHAPWSVDYMDATGGGERVDERLGAAGVRREDVAELHHRAMARLAAISPRR